MRLIRRTAVLVSIFLCANAGATQAGKPRTDSAERLFATGDLSLIFTGKVLEADRKVRPCRVTCGIRLVTFSVGQVLLGFSPGAKVSVDYGRGAPDPLFDSKSELLVFAVRGVGGRWSSTYSMLQPATAENVIAARQIGRSHLEHLIANYKAHHTNWQKLVFVGTVVKTVDPYPPLAPCKQALPFPIVFRVDELISGKWDGDRVTVVFGDCQPPPDPPVGVGSKIVVLAQVTRDDKAYGYARDLLSEESAALIRTKMKSTSH